MIIVFIWCFCISISQLPGQRRAVPGLQLPEGQRFVRIPVEIQHNVILIPVKVNGSFEMTFILDTGVRTTILTEPFITQFLRLDSLTRVKVRGLGEGEAIDATLAQDVSFTLPNGIQGRQMKLLVLPDDVISYSGMFGRPVYGIMGYDLFSRFVVEINYARKYITLYDPLEFRPRKKDIQLDIQLRDGKPYLEAFITDFRGERIRGQWLLDTGSSNAIALYDHSLPLPEPSIPAFLGKGLSGNVYGRLARARSFEIGPFELEEVIAGYPDPSSLNISETDSTWYGNVGAEVLSRFLVTFDYYRNHVYLRKLPGYRLPFEYNVSGLEVISEGANFDQFLIAYVRPDSPAAEAGVAVGDELISLNGFEVHGMDINSLYATLLRRNGKTIVVRLRRNGEVMKKRFELIPEI